MKLFTTLPVVSVDYLSYFRPEIFWGGFFIIYDNKIANSLLWRLF